MHQIPVKIILLVCALLMVSPAWSATYNFTVAAVSGGLNGTQASGSFTHAALTEGQSLGVSFSSFSFTWDGVTYDEGDVLIGFINASSTGQMYGEEGFPSSNGSFGSRCQSGRCSYGGNGGQDFVIHFGHPRPGEWAAQGVSGHEIFRYTRADGSSGLGTVVFELQYKYWVST